MSEKLVSVSRPSGIERWELTRRTKAVAIEDADNWVMILIVYAHFSSVDETDEEIIVKIEFDSSFTIDGSPDVPSQTREM